MKVQYVVEMEVEKGRLLWGPFPEATQAAEWAMKHLSQADQSGVPKLPLDWIVKPVRPPEL